MAEKKTNIVTMKNGTELDFGQRGKLKKNIAISGEGAERTIAITVDCINGDTHTMVFDASDPLFFEYAAHGVSQKLTDSITKAEDYEDVSFGVSNTISQLQSGKWTVRNVEGLVRGFSDLLEALRRIKDFKEGSEEAINLKTALVSKSEDEIKLYKTNPGVKAVLATIVSEKAAAKAARLAEETAGSSADDLVI